MPADEYEGFDTNAVAAEIGAELFSPVSEEAPVAEVAPVAETPPPVAAETPTEQPAPAIVPGQNSVMKPLPKSWKKDMAPHWEKLSPEVHEYVYAREADVMKGIQQYQQGYQQWDALVKPFAPIFQQHQDINPVQLMQGLMNTHLQLLNPNASPQQKAALAQRILRDYGITLEGMPSGDAALQQEVQTLRQQLGQIQQSFQSRERAEYQAGVDKHLSDIEAFAADPKNEYFNELGPDILRFVQNGVADSLSAAYEMACWSNPGVRAKILAKQQATTPPAVQRDAKGKFVNLDSVDAPPRTRVKGTIDSTIDNIVASHYSKH